MAESKLVSLRVPVELWEWAGSYAAKRRSTKTAIVEAALREFREAAEGGVPELEETRGHGASSAGEVRRPAARPPSASPRASVQVPHVASVREMKRPVPVGRSEYERTMRARQERLNKGKG